jgi:nucleoside-diphosphate-sugar epimerase
MESAKPVVVVTGIAGNLGQRLLPLLGDFAVIGVDLGPPQTDLPMQFERMDLGEESTTRAFYELLHDTRPVSVVHLAFVIDPVRTGVLEPERMWQINVAGTARVMEAITEANRSADSPIRQFIFPSSVSAYGPNLPSPATEDSAMAAHTLPYAIHKKQSDEVVQQRAGAARVQRVHSASAYFCRGQRGELSVGGVSGHSQRQGRAGGEDAERGQTAALHAAARATVSG